MTNDEIRRTEGALKGWGSRKNNFEYGGVPSLTPALSHRYLFSLTLTQRGWLEEDTFVYLRSGASR